MIFIIRMTCTLLGNVDHIMPYDCLKAVQNKIPIAIVKTNVKERESGVNPGQYPLL